MRRRSRIVIIEDDGKYAALGQERRFCMWRTVWRTCGFETVPACLADVAGYAVQLTRAKFGSKLSRQQRRAQAREVAKIVG